MNKKIIALSSKIIKTPNMPDHNGDIISYVNAVSDAGAIPIFIPFLQDKRDIDTILSLVDGVVMTGGSDIHPDLYGEDPHPKLGEVFIERDLFEIKILKAAIKRELPIVGVCRGMQLANVVCGGSLYQDLESQLEDVIGHDLVSTVQDYHHKIYIEEDSFLDKIFNEEIIKVGSIHHQGIKKLGKGFKIAAKAGDGVIEAVENPSINFVGTQFHPEEVYKKDSRFLDIFKYGLGL